MANVSAPHARLDDLLKQLVAEQRLLSPPEMDYTSHFMAVKEDTLKSWTDNNRISPTLSIGECHRGNDYNTTAKDHYAANGKLFKIHKNRPGEKVNTQVSACFAHHMICYISVQLWRLLCNFAALSSGLCQKEAKVRGRRRE